MAASSLFPDATSSVASFTSLIILWTFSIKVLTCAANSPSSSFDLISIRLVKSPSPFVKLLILSTKILSGLITLAFSMIITITASIIANTANVELTKRARIWPWIILSDALLTSLAESFS